MNQSFTGRCQYCRAHTKVRFTKVRDNTWKTFELDGTGLHHCKKDNWSLSSLRHKFTCKTYCWWCGDTVFYHTQGYGDSVLFDKLGDPWEIHPCWEKHKSIHESFTQNLEKLLIAAGYSGEQEFDILAGGTWQTLQRCGVRINSADYKLLEKTTELIVSVLKKHGADFHGPIPLPRRKYRSSDISNFEEIRHKRLIHILLEDKEKESKARNAIQEMKSLDVPMIVEISFASN